MMNDLRQKSQPVDPAALDRLVDGELPETQRRELLTSLDRQPDGWRRCALAFLEAQSWGDAVGELTRRPEKPVEATSAAAPAAVQAVAAQRPAATRPAAQRPTAQWSSWKSLLAMAASFLVTFGLGMGLQRMWNGSGNSSSLTPSVAPSPGDIGKVQMPEAMPASNEQVQVSVNDPNGQQRSFTLPLVNVSQAPQALFQQNSAVMPDNVRRALEQSGRQVRSQRQFYPVTLPDGRQVIVPIDQVEVVPVGVHGVQ